MNGAGVHKAHRMTTKLATADNTGYQATSLWPFAKLLWSSDIPETLSEIGLIEEKESSDFLHWNHIRIGVLLY